MSRKTLLKSLATCAFAVMSVLVVATSVPDGGAYSSKGFEQEQTPESTKGAAGALARVRSALKRRRTAPYLAAAVEQKAPAKPALLAAVRKNDIKEHHQKIADAVLRALPAPCRDNLKNFYVRYENVTQRGLGGKTTIIIDGTAPDNEFIALLVHECAHVTHANAFGNPASGESAFKDGNDVFYNDSPIVDFFAMSWTGENVLKRGAKATDFVSGYAESDAFEDFAESFAMYVLHRPSMRERAKSNAAIAAKLAWMEEHLPLSETALASDDLYAWNKKVPWDVTKLPYTTGVR